MKTVLAIAAALVSLAGAGFAYAPTALAWTPPAEAAGTLAAGKAWSEVAPGPDGAGLIHAAVDVPVPPKVVWAVMNDCRLINRLIVTAVSCRVLEGDAERGGWDVRETVTKGNFFIPSIHNVYRSDYQPYSLIRFRKAGGNLKVEQGEWRLEPLNGGAGTRVIYENLVAASILAPAALVREGMRRDTAKVLANLRTVTLSQPR